MTTPTRRPPLPALTGLRALAAVWVVLFHYREDVLALVPALTPLDTFLGAGYLGVDLFFPLSGFVLAYTYADAMSTFRWRQAGEFVRNRFARVWPVHALTLHVDLVIAACVGALGVAADGHRRTLPAYLENLAMVHTWWNDRPSFNGPAWSISSEWFAYLCAPLLFVLAARLRRGGSALLLAAASYAAMLAVFATTALPNGNLEHMFYVRIMGEFVGGMLLCLAWLRGGVRMERAAVVLPLTLGVVAVLPVASAGHYWAAPALGLAVAGLAASQGRVARVLSWRWMVLAGEASYALYLTHVLVQPLVASATGWAAGSPVRSFLAGTGVVLGLGAVAWLVHTRVEQPARRWLQRAGRRRSARPADPAAEHRVAGSPAASAPEHGLVRVPV
jgi:peptidoglycan/LPS O-acetylase OafA/YrhL